MEYEVNDDLSKPIETGTDGTMAPMRGNSPKRHYDSWPSVDDIGGEEEEDEEMGDPENTSDASQ